MELKHRLRELRNEKGLTQSELARIIGWKPSTIASWEQGKSNPDLGSLVKVAKFFNVSVDYLLCLTEEKQPSKKYYYSGGELAEYGVTGAGDLDPDMILMFNQLTQAKDITPDLLKAIIDLVIAAKNSNE